MARLVGAVWRGVKDVTRAVLLDDDECRDLQDDEEDEPTVFEVRARVDQVLHFFENDHDRYAGYVEDSKKLEALRIDYYNCINTIEFQNELIAQLVDEIIVTRARARADPSSRKEASIALANAKMDISDRKSKRFFKERDRRELLQVISPSIAEIKLRRLLEEQENAMRPAEEVTTTLKDGKTTPAQPQPARRGRGFEAVSSYEPGEEVCATSMESNRGGLKARGKRYKNYTDDEIASLLREKDL